MACLLSRGQLLSISQYSNQKRRSATETKLWRNSASGPLYLACFCIAWSNYSLFASAESCGKLKYTKHLHRHAVRSRLLSGGGNSEAPCLALSLLQLAWLDAREQRRQILQSASIGHLCLPGYFYPSSCFACQLTVRRSPGAPLLWAAGGVDTVRTYSDPASVPLQWVSARRVVGAYIALKKKTASEVPPVIEGKSRRRAMH